MDAERTSKRNGLIGIVLVVGAVVLLVPFVLMAFMMPMMWMFGGMGAGGGALISPLWGIGMMVVVLLVVIGIGYALFRILTRIGVESGDSAIEELRIAYATGELSQEEFEQRRDDLLGGRDSRSR